MSRNRSNSSPLLWRYLLILAVNIPLFFSSPHGATAESCTQLLTNRCETCHYLTKICRKIEREQEKTYWFGGPENSWKKSIRNMVAQGANLTAAEEEKLVECLSKPHPDVLSLCRLSK